MPMPVVHGDRTRLTPGCHRLGHREHGLLLRMLHLSIYTSGIHLFDFIVIHARTTAYASTAQATYHFRSFTFMLLYKVVSHFRIDEQDRLFVVYFSTLSSRIRVIPVYNSRRLIQNYFRCIILACAVAVIEYKRRAMIQCQDVVN